MYKYRIGQKVNVILPYRDMSVVGRIVEPLTLNNDKYNDKYLVKILYPSSAKQRYPLGMIEVSEEDLAPYDIIQIRSKKQSNPKSKRCSCKKK